MRSIAFGLVVMALAASAFAATSPSLAPTTTNNDDSCDIGVMPAATLLLPYFEVDFKSPASKATTTLFTVQNVTGQPQIANVTLWTDWAYPAFSFSIFLTGYDVQPINLWDIFSRGIIAPGQFISGTSSDTVVPINPTLGSQAGPNNSNAHFLPDAMQSCRSLPGPFPNSALTDLQQIFTTGKVVNGLLSPCTSQVGGVHANAIGYVTVDVVATCYRGIPASADYFQTAMLFDNVLVGDYQHLFPGKYALGGPMVHIRAIPEGGAAGAATGTSLPYTFYDRLTGSATFRDIDRRQPLPSAFTPRYIEGGTSTFNTSFKIWREAFTGANATCSDYAANSNIPYVEIVRFDEHENATVAGGSILLPPPPPGPPGTPVTLMLPTTYSFFPPPSTSGDIAGWMYLNLNNGGSRAYTVGIGPGGVARDFVTNSSTTTGLRQSQAWVLTSMYADPTYALEGSALAVGNGCSLAPMGGAQIGPAANANP